MQRKTVIEAAEKRGHETYVRWTRDGTLLSSTEFAPRWGVTRQALEQAVERGELFSLKVGNRRYYPSVFLSLTRPLVAEITRTLGSADADEKLIFMLRTHGGLGGRSIAEAVSAGMEDRVLNLAQSWAEERGLQHADSPA